MRNKYRLQKLERVNKAKLAGKKIAVYTCLYGNYDDLYDGFEKHPQIDYIVFTDNPNLESSVWETVYKPFVGLSREKASRVAKIQSNEYLPEYDITLYIDANISIVGSVYQFILENYTNGISLCRHHYRKTLAEEFTRVENSDRFKGILTEISIQKEKYLSTQSPFKDDLGLYMNGIILRSRSDKVSELERLWWAEIEAHTHRDQLSLMWCLWDTGISVSNLDNVSVESTFKIRDCHGSSINNKIYQNYIHHIVPWGTGKMYGDAVNDECSRVPNDDWVCLRDGDTMWTTFNWGDQLLDIVTKHRNIHLFSCYTNRIGLDYQLLNGEFSDNPDISYHRNLGQEMSDKYYSDIEIINKPVAGLLMLFKKSTWNRIKFIDELIGSNGNYFDYEFSSKVLKNGGKIALMKGVYLFHYYRMNEGGKYYREHLKN